MTSDKLPDSPSKFSCIQLWMTRRIWHRIKSHLRPYSTHPFNYCYRTCRFLVGPKTDFSVPLCKVFIFSFTRRMKNKCKDLSRGKWLMCLQQHSQWRNLKHFYLLQIKPLICYKHNHGTFLSLGLKRMVGTPLCCWSVLDIQMVEISKKSLWQPVSSCFPTRVQHL